MDVELLVVPECPNEEAAHVLIGDALAELDMDTGVVTTVIETDDQARSRGFIGSPTFLINGRDPFDEPGAAVGVACRVYKTPAGFSPTPSLAELRAALERAAAEQPFPSAP